MQVRAVEVGVKEKEMVRLLVAVNWQCLFWVRAITSYGGLHYELGPQRHTSSLVWLDIHLKSDTRMSFTIGEDNAWLGKYSRWQRPKRMTERNLCLLV